MKLLDAVTATGAGDALTLPSRTTGRDKLVTQIDLTLGTGVATVAIEGRLSGSATWMPLFTAVSADDIREVPWVDQIRANVTAYTSGAVSVWVATDR